MSKFLEAAKCLATLLDNISERFQVDYKEINLATDEMAGLIITVCVPVLNLGIKHWSDEDFHNFCKQNELNGVIFFNKDYTVTFSMTPVTGTNVTKKSKNMTILRTANEGGTAATCPRITDEMFDLLHKGAKIPAIKLYREMTYTTLPFAKAACEQGYYLECAERGLTPHKYQLEFNCYSDLAARPAPDEG